jgi:hypothetical protein
VSSDRLEREFRQFHEANPQIFDRLVELARKAKFWGRRHYGIAALWEVMRWDFFSKVNSPIDEFKLNNNHRAYYARLIMATCPDLDGFFHTRGDEPDADS